MLNWLMQELAVFDAGFSVFQYITLRGILSAGTALLISLLVGPSMIRRLDSLQIGQSVRDDGPQSHLSKSGTHDGRRVDYCSDSCRHLTVGRSK